MQYRELGRTGWKVSEIGFGAWAIGGAWGDVDDTESLAALHGRSSWASTSSTPPTSTATAQRAARRPGLARPPRPAHPRGDQGRPPPARADRRGLRPGEPDRLGRSEPEEPGRRHDCLLQLHCPPTALYSRPEVFGILDDFVAAGKLRHYGVSVEKVEEAIKAIEFPGVQTVQIIFNMFRVRRPSSSSRWRKRRGRHPRPRAAGQRHAHRQDEAGPPVHRGRSPQLQPPR